MFINRWQLSQCNLSVLLNLCSAGNTGACSLVQNAYVVWLVVEVFVFIINCTYCTFVQGVSIATCLTCPFNALSQLWQRRPCVCLSVCLSHSAALSKWHKLGSRNL